MEKNEFKRAFSAKAQVNSRPLTGAAVVNPYGGERKFLTSAKTFKIKQFMRPKVAPIYQTMGAPTSKDGTDPNQPQIGSYGTGDSLMNLQKRNHTLSKETDFFRHNVNMFDKERIFEQLQQAKTQINSLIEDNFQIKTKNLQLDKQGQKYEKIIEDFQSSGNMRNVQMKLGVETSLFLQMKKQVKELQLESKEKIQVLDKMKKNIKVTQFQELEAEKMSLYDELRRLRTLIDQYEDNQKGYEQWQQNNNNLIDTVQYLKQANEGMQRDNLEMTNIINLYEERNKQMQNSLKQQNSQNIKLQRDNFLHLQKNQSHNKKNKTSGTYIITQEEMDQEIENKTNMLYQLEDYKTKISELESSLKKHQNDNRKQLEQKRPQVRQHENGSQLERENPLLQRVPKVSEQDAQLIADEIKFTLIRLNITYQHAKNVNKQQKNKSFIPPEIQKKSRINQEQIKTILTSEPFNLRDKEKVELLSRYIVECDNTDQYVQPNSNTTKLINTAIVKNQLTSLIDRYSLSDEYEEYDEQSLMQIIKNLFDQYEGQLFQYWTNDLKQITYLTKTQLDDMFVKLNMDFEQVSYQYYFSYVFQKSDSDFRRIPALTALKPFQNLFTQKQNTQHTKSNSHFQVENVVDEFEEEIDEEDYSKQEFEKEKQGDDLNSSDLVTLKQEKEFQLSKIELSDVLLIADYLTYKLIDQGIEYKKFIDFFTPQSNKDDNLSFKDIKQLLANNHFKLLQKQINILAIYIVQSKFKQNTFTQNQLENQTESIKNFRSGMMALVPHYELQNLDNEQEIIEKIEEQIHGHRNNLMNKWKQKYQSSATLTKNQVEELFNSVHLDLGDKKKQQYFLHLFQKSNYNFLKIPQRIVFHPFEEELNTYKLQREKEQRIKQEQDKLEELEAIQQQKELDQVAIKIQNAYKLKQQKKEGKATLEQMKKDQLHKEKVLREEQEAIQQQKELDEVAVKIQNAYKLKQQKKEGKAIIEQMKRDQLKREKALLEEQEAIQQQKELDDVAVKIQNAYKLKQQKKEGKAIIEQMKKDQEQQQLAKKAEEAEAIQQQKELDQVAVKIQAAYKLKQQKLQGKATIEQMKKDQLLKAQIKKAEELEAIQQQKELDEVAVKIQNAYKLKQKKKEGKAIIEQMKLDKALLESIILDESDQVLKEKIEIEKISDHVQTSKSDLHQQEQHPHQQEQHPHQQEQHPHQQEQHPHQQEQHPHQQEQHPHQQEQHPHQQEQHPHQQKQNAHQQKQNPHQQDQHIHKEEQHIHQEEQHHSIKQHDHVETVQAQQVQESIIIQNESVQVQQSNQDLEEQEAIQQQKELDQVALKIQAAYKLKQQKKEGQATILKMKEEQKINEQKIELHSLNQQNQNKHGDNTNDIKVEEHKNIPNNKHSEDDNPVIPKVHFEQNHDEINSDRNSFNDSLIVQGDDHQNIQLNKDKVSGAQDQF